MKTFLLLSLFVISTTTWARPPYLNELLAEYSNAKSLQTLRCAVCHNNGRQLNAFGHDYADVIRRSSLSTPEEKAEAYKKLGLMDSDKDGVANLQELIAGTNPGKAEQEKAEEAQGETSYYFGDVQYLSADGKTVFKTAKSLIKRVVDSTKKTIVELVTQSDDTDSSKSKEFETLFERIGQTNEFKVSDSSKSFSGSIVFSGVEWKWDQWSYRIDLLTGEKLKGEGKLDEKGITTKKQLLNLDGTVKVLINETLSVITEEEYKTKKQGN